MDVEKMAIGDSLEKLIAARRASVADNSQQELAATRETLFTPITQQLRAFVSSVDARFIKSKLTKDRAVIRIGSGEIDVGWEIAPNPAHKAPDDGKPLLRVMEIRNFMSDDSTQEMLFFADGESLIAYLDHAIELKIESYTGKLASVSG